MEPIYMPDETKRIIEELHDPLLLVEFNPISMKWEISKLAHGISAFWIPGYLADSTEEFVNLTYSFEYYSVQGAFEHWGQHIFDAMRRGRPEFQETKEICNDIQVLDDKVQARNKAEMDDCREQTKKEILKRWSPTIYSYDNQKVS